MLGQLRASSALTALVSTRVYLAEHVPHSAVLPMVTLQFLAGSDYRTLGGGRRVMTNTVYLAKAVLDLNATGDAHATGAAVVDALDAALDGVIGLQLTPGLFIQGCIRLAPVRYAETGDAGRFLHWGGRYRIWVD